MSTSNGGWDFSGYTPPPGGAPAPDQGFGGQQAFGGPQGFGDHQGFGGQQGFAGQQGFGGSPDMFGTSALGAETAPLQPVAAPTGWLFAGLGLAFVAGLAASLFGGVPAVAIACWALAGPVVIGLFAVYLTKDVRSRAHLNYSPPTWGAALYAVGLVVAFIAVMIASLQIAFWIGRM